MEKRTWLHLSLVELQGVRSGRANSLILAPSFHFASPNPACDLISRGLQNLAGPLASGSPSLSALKASIP